MDALQKKGPRSPNGIDLAAYEKPRTASVLAKSKHPENDLRKDASKEKRRQLGLDLELHPLALSDCLASAGDDLAGVVAENEHDG